MMERMPHAEYINGIPTDAGRAAADALAGRIHLLEACHALSSLLARADLEPRDPDLAAFVLVSSETDDLPVGSVRDRWDTGALENIQPEIDSAIAWARPIATPALESVVLRFKA